MYFYPKDRDGDSNWSFISKDIFNTKTRNGLYLKKLLETYDVEKFKESKILNSFTWGKPLDSVLNVTHTTNIIEE